MDVCLSVYGSDHTYIYVNVCLCVCSHEKTALIMNINTSIYCTLDKKKTKWYTKRHILNYLTEYYFCVFTQSTVFFLNLFFSLKQDKNQNTSIIVCLYIIEIGSLYIYIFQYFSCDRFNPRNYKKCTVTCFLSLLQMYILYI